MTVSNVDLLAQAPLFKALPREELRQLAASLQTLEVPPGTILLREGEVGTHFYIILAGLVEVIKLLGAPEERLLARRTAGEFVGELSFLSLDKQHTATVRAVQLTHLWQITHAELDRVLHRHPSIAYEMLDVLAGRLATAHDAAIHDLHEKNKQLQAAYNSLQAAQAQLVEKKELERELQLAYEIQMSLLPQKMPVHARYAFGAQIVPAHQVGGDFYDVIPLDDTGQRFGVVIGDVSGKGVPAALFMAQTRALLFAEAQQDRSPREVLERLNRYLLQMNATGQFVTVIYGVLDTGQSQFNYARCGHEFPIQITPHQPAHQVAHHAGNPLGVMEDPTIDEQTLTLAPGGLIVLFTDGVTDARNEDDTASFGLERLLAAAQTVQDQPAQIVCERLLSATKNFQQNAPQYDDITLVAISCFATPPNL